MLNIECGIEQGFCRLGQKNLEMSLDSDSSASPLPLPSMCTDSTLPHLLHSDHLPQAACPYLDYHSDLQAGLLLLSFSLRTIIRVATHSFKILEHITPLLKTLWCFPSLRSLRSYALFITAPFLLVSDPMALAETRILSLTKL